MKILKILNIDKVFFYFLVAGSGIEPLTSGLWVPRSNQLSYPAIKFTLIYTTYFFSFKQEIKKLRLIRVSLWTTSGPKLDQKFWSSGSPWVIYFFIVQPFFFNTLIKFSRIWSLDVFWSPIFSKNTGSNPLSFFDLK